MGQTGEDGRIIKTGEQGWEESMSGGKAVPVALIKAASPRSRGDEDHRESLGLPRRGLGGAELVLRPWRGSVEWRG